MPGVSRTAREQWPKYQMGRRGWCCDRQEVRGHTLISIFLYGLGGSWKMRMWRIVANQGLSLP